MPKNDLNFQTREDIRARLRLNDVGILSQVEEYKESLFVVDPMIIGRKLRDIHKCRGNLRYILRKLHRALRDIPIPDEFYGGIRGKDVIGNAKRHSGKKYVMSMDICNFFPSIKPKHVHEVFKRLGCTDEMAALLTHFTTANDHLPQGFPTSPILSAHFLIPIAEELMAKLPRDLIFTFWIDDLTISGNVSPAEYIPMIKGIAKSHDMKINNSKTHVGKQGVSLRKVTGVVINENGFSPNIGYTREVEQMIEILNRHGVDVLNDCFSKEYRSDEIARSKLRSKVMWISRFNKNKALELLKRTEEGTKYRMPVLV